MRSITLASARSRFATGLGNRAPEFCGGDFRDSNGRLHHHAGGAEMRFASRAARASLASRSLGAASRRRRAASASSRLSAGINKSDGIRAVKLRVHRPFSPAAEISEPRRIASARNAGDRVRSAPLYLARRAFRVPFTERDLQRCYFLPAPAFQYRARSFDAVIQRNLEMISSTIVPVPIERDPANVAPDCYRVTVLYLASRLLILPVEQLPT